jgi:hypothetical protein
MFDNFEQANQLKKVRKFMKMDQFEKTEMNAQEKLDENPNDTAALADYASAKAKLDRAIPNYEKIKVLVKDYDKLGAEKIAQTVYDQGLLKHIEVSRLRDQVRNANNFLIHEAMAIEDEAIAREFKIEKRKLKNMIFPLPNI